MQVNPYLLKKNHKHATIDSPSQSELNYLWQLLLNAMHCMPVLVCKESCIGQLTKFELTLWNPAAFRDFHARTTGSHMAFRARNLGAECGRELFKGSKDTTCLLVCTRK